MTILLTPLLKKPSFPPYLLKNHWVKYNQRKYQWLKIQSKPLPKYSHLHIISLTITTNKDTHPLNWASLISITCLIEKQMKNLILITKLRQQRLAIWSKNQRLLENLILTQQLITFLKAWWWMKECYSNLGKCYNHQLSSQPVKVKNKITKVT